MFSNKGTTSALWKSLAIEFQGQIIVAQARDTETAVVKEFNVDKYPTLVVLPGGSAPGIVYSGAMEPDPLNKFLSEYAPVANAEESPVKKSPFKPKQEPLGMYITKLYS
jgi:protein disulfide-isomerase A6